MCVIFCANDHEILCYILFACFVPFFHYFKQILLFKKTKVKKKIIITGFHKFIVVNFIVFEMFFFSVKEILPK